ncbi:MAG: ABC transporter ATP-binding protein [Bacilli bacterium]|nr:ABC transporter ATP-binding protein [Bacilli bacterium]
MKEIIELKKVSKKYPTFELGEINLTLESGKIIGLIGENGAGKTTLIKGILNIIKTEGAIKLFGQNENEKNKEEIGIVLDDAFFPEILKPKEVENIMKKIYKNWDSEQFQNYIKRFNLDYKKPIKNMSKGMKKKLEIACALSHKPKLLILDEPTSGLDPIIRNEVLDIFQEYMEDETHTILISSHITTDLERIADQIILIDKGKIKINEDKDEIIDNYGILKCDEKEYKEIEQEDIINYKKTKYSYEILIKNREKLSKKYKNYIIDKITLDELMLLTIKGEKQC